MITPFAGGLKTPSMKIEATLYRGNTMKDQEKSKVRLIAELEEMRQRVSEMEKTAAKFKQTEQELRLSEETMRGLIDQSPLSIKIFDISGAAVHANRAWEELWGVPWEEFVKFDYNIFKDEQFKKLGLMPFLERALAGEAVSLPAREYNPRVNTFGSGLGFKRWVKAWIYPIKDDSGRVRNVIITHEDITERKRAEEALRESEAKFRSVIEQSNDAIYILYNNRYDLINPRFTELIGITPEDLENPDFTFLGNLKIESRAPGEEGELVWAKVVTSPGVYEFSLTKNYRKRRHVQVSVSEIHYRDGKALLGILRDISDRKSLEVQLRQAQKIESIGHLAGGIAHDFNNLLTPIIGNSELAMMSMERSNPFYNDFHEIHQTARRASDLTRQLLAFSRKQDLNVITVDLNELIENFRKILRRAIREDIHIEIKLGSSLGSVRVDVSQIEQILMNLLVNAQDAMPNGGRVTVETRAVELDQAYANNHTGVTPGQYVMLMVSDTGEGMDEDTIHKIFDPFFTTKDMGEGTGLGLATVYGIVKQHGGSIWVRSEPGAGATFKLYLPIVSGDAATRGDSMQNTGRYHGTGDILIVEDKESVRQVAARILQSHGYTVYLASDGEEAAAMMNTKNLPIDLLLTDVIMPKMNGRELYDLLSKTHPELKVLYMSGYTRNIISRHGVLEKGIDFIPKPLRVDSLVSKVKEMLERE